MTLLPLVEREMRVAARRGRTYWLRFLAALAAAAICAWVCLVSARAQPAYAMGKSLFTLLSILGFAYCLLVGPFLTADSVSEEKRDGTLGLLFLTELRSWQVVLGKWVASSFAGFLGLLAILPALGIPLLLGGVTPGEYGRTALGVVNALFFSMSAGMLVSTLSREQARATLGTVIVVLGLSAMLPGLVVLVGSVVFEQPVSTLERSAWISPAWAGVQALDAAYRADPQPYWISLGLSHAMSWGFLVATALWMPRVWRDQVEDKPVRFRWLWRFGYTRGWRARFRRRLERNPIHAVWGRLRWPHLVFWTLVSLVAINVYWLTYGYQASPGSARFHQNFAYGLVFTNRVWICVMACHLMLEARRTGALELLLTTPLRTATLLRGHWRSLRSYFFWPLLAIAGLHVFYVAGTWSNVGSRYPVGLPYFEGLVVTAVSSYVSFLTDVLALCYVGTWLSVASRRPNLAIFLTILLVILLPHVVTQALTGVRTAAPDGLTRWFLKVPGLGIFASTPFFLYPAVRATWVVLKNLLFIAWARQRLRNHFRSAAAQTYTWR